MALYSFYASKPPTALRFPRTREAWTWNGARRARVPDAILSLLRRTGVGSAQV